MPPRAPTPGKIICETDDSSPSITSRFISSHFTDPPYGRINARVGELRPQDLDICAVYRLDLSTNALTLLVDDFDRPNGLCFSTDESSLFVNDSAHNHIRVFDVQDDGMLANGRVWAQLVGDGVGPADGMKIDSEGNVYCTGPGGIHIFNAAANCLGVIHVPEQTANLCFGGDDYRSLYITASTSLYRLHVRIPGRSLLWPKWKSSKHKEDLSI